MAGKSNNSSNSENNEISFSELMHSYNVSSSDAWIRFCDFIESHFGEFGRFLSRNILKRITVNAPIVLGFVSICTGLHILSETILPGLPRWLGVGDRFFTNDVFLSVWKAPLAVLNLVTHVFVHADWNHLRGNMVHMLLVGPSVEHEFGHKNLFRIMGVVAITSAVVHILVGKSNTYQHGASGVVFACILLNSLVSASVGTIPLSFLIVSVWWIGDELWKFVFGRDNVSHHAHITGGVVGTIMGYYIHKKRAQKKVDSIATQWYQGILKIKKRK